MGGAGQARTSTIWPLKISSAFWINGSFLNSSTLTLRAASRLAGAGTVCVAAGLAAAALGVGGADAREAGASAWTNLIWTLGWPSSCEFGLQQCVGVLVIHEFHLVGKFGIEANGQHVLLQ